MYFLKWHYFFFYYLHLENYLSYNYPSNSKDCLESPEIIDLLRVISIIKMQKDYVRGPPKKLMNAKCETQDRIPQNIPSHDN